MKNNPKKPGGQAFIDLLPAYTLLQKNYDALSNQYVNLNEECRQAFTAIRGITKILNQLAYISDTIVNAVESRRITDADHGLRKTSEDLNLEVERLRKIASGLRSF